MSPDHDLFLTAREVAALLRVTPLTLARWRALRKGPPFQRLESRIRYRQAQVMAWLEDQTVCAGHQRFTRRA